MKRLRMALCCWIGGTILLGAWLLTPISKPTGTAPTISFCGFTNEQGINKALFTISNAATTAIFYKPLAPEWRNTGELWESENAVGFNKLLGPLEPGFVTNITSSQTNVGIWRLPVAWAFVPGTREFAHERFRQNWQAIAELRTLPGWQVGIGLVALTNFSSSITNDHLVGLP